MVFQKGNTDKRKDITGKKYGYLIAIRPVYKYSHGKTQEWVWSAKCVCGKIIEKRIGQLTTGDSKSCGCMSAHGKRMAKLGEKNPMWVGDNVGYSSLHSWVHRRMKKPTTCENCHKRPAEDLANKGVYNRELKNWYWLCKKCHVHSDGRIYLAHGKKPPSWCNTYGKKEFDRDHAKGLQSHTDASG